MSTSNYYAVHIAGMPCNYQIFSRLKDARQYVLENYPFFQCFILARRRKDDFPLFAVSYFPKSGFTKTIRV